MSEPTEVGVERGELIVGRYELLKRLGRGGMGEVWAARDRTLHRDVAVKLLDLDGVDHPELPQRFEREAVAAAQINHPNVVALYDRGIHEDMLFLVMEKVEGATLTELVHAERPVSLARVLEIASGICAALVAAHRAQVIHYDIKPHNVMLTSDGQVKVVDFGIAGFIHTSFTVARSSQLTPAGTPEYGAPEQFLTERGDERSDLYALGGVLFAMLTRKPPFTGHNGLAVMRRKLDEAAPCLDSLRPDLPSAVTALVADLLQRDPGRRPQTARQVQERLQQLQALHPGNGGTSDAKTPVVQPPTLPMDPQPTRPEGPFTILWTGKEPLSSYTDTRELRSITASMAKVSAVGLAGVVISLGMGGRPGQGNGWSFVFMASSIVGIIMLMGPLGVGALRLIYDRSAWSLQIGPQGIRTTIGFGRHEYQCQWNHVQLFAINRIKGENRLAGIGNWYQSPAALCVKFTKGAKRSAVIPLAGWPFPVAARVRNGRVPVCVLGPMTDQQRTALREALARYGHGKSDAEAWGE
ncbi:serine/threonine-protein kinase [Streptomyces sp. NPDC126510]|uniref:serine/threonine-protein kinase n=1 Tax=Streptomyces sp. NPDC126510 TaxID=3155317 RepID=UPI00331F438E